MTTSIKTRLILWVIGGMAVLLGVFAVVVYEVMSRSLVGAFDEVLASTARRVHGFIEQDDVEIKVETDERELPEFYRTARPDYFQVWGDDGRTIARSPSLADDDLEQFEGPLDSFVFRSVRLPDGRTGRAVSVLFAPKVDEDVVDLGTPRNVTLEVARETGSLDAEITFLKTSLGAATGGTIILALLVGAAVVNRGLRPFGVLASRIAGIRHDDLSVRLSVKAMPAEMAPVVDRLNDLLRQLEEAMSRERTFTADAAHELRTPLAGLRSIMEVRLARPRAGEDYRQAITECLDIVRHTQSMIDNLLALARLDSEQTALHPEELRLGEVIETVWRPLTEQTVARGITVESRIPPGLACITDRDNLDVALTVLAANAVEYTNDHGRIEVIAQQSGNSVELTVANSGCSLTQEEARHVFERFWRGDVSRSQTGIHCGLGLAIAKRIVTSLGGTITASANGNVFAVHVILPVSPA